MRVRFRHFADKLRTSLWFVPSVMAIAAVALSQFTLAVDARRPEAGRLPFIWNGSSEGGSAVLGTLAGSMIGVIGVTFSVTVVALSLASSQFGPRLLRNFMRDRANQLVLGMFIATFTFALLGLRAVAGGGEDAPAVTVTVAVLLGLLSLGFLIHFIHHISASIQAPTIIANVAAELDALIDVMYPEDIGEGGPPPDEPSWGLDGHVVRAPRTGYLQAVDEEDLLDVTRRHDVTVRIDVLPGDFVMEGTPLVVVAPAPRLTEDLTAELQALFLVGHLRTAEQDVEFSIDQLVEIAIRALSPGINDPFTALTCIDRLAAAVARLARRRFPSPYRYDADGQLRIIAVSPSFGDLVDASFAQIREYGASSASVAVRLLEAMDRVAHAADLQPKQRDVLARHADRTLAAAEHAGHERHDIETIRSLHAAVRESLGGSAAGSARG